MKTRTMTALAVVLLAAASLPAAAQERGDRGGRDRGGARAEFRQDRGADRGSAARAPERSFQRGPERARQDGGERRSLGEPPARAPEARPAAQAAPQAPRAVRAPEAPRARAVDQDRPDMWRSDRQRGEVRPDRAPDRARPGGERPDGWRDNDRDRRGSGDRARAGRWDGDRRGWDNRWSRADRDRWDRNDRDRDRRRGDRPYWSQGRYPFSYSSARRYRGPAWVAPPGFYFRTWSMGDYLPWGWYGPNYRLDDWWDYGLPWPPPGFDWVRNGPDVLLVDRFSGRIVQVVRMVFW